ncbi:MAG: hypothetical protein C0475_03810 [Planctomyces sp.]|nr:hypothetical protein [Planctomyces sp.]
MTKRRASARAGVADAGAQGAAAGTPGGRGGGHAERALEEMLRRAGVEHVSVAAARPVIAPGGWNLRAVLHGERGGPDRTVSLKAFDYALYGPRVRVLVEVKGRKVSPGALAAVARGRLESWATAEDVVSLERWEALFGPGHAAAFVFVYWSDRAPAGPAAADEGDGAGVLALGGRWYAARGVLLRDYTALMKQRSPRWRTVDLPATDFARVAVPLARLLEVAERLDPGQGAP